MRKQFSKLVLTVTLMLAITFTISCSLPDDENSGGGNLFYNSKVCELLSDKETGFFTYAPQDLAEMVSLK